jgi:hypothetical protein
VERSKAAGSCKGKQQYSQLLLPTGSLDMLEVEYQDNNWRLSFHRRQKYLELDVLVQERPLPDKGLRPCRRTAGKDEEGWHLHPEPLVGKHLFVTDPVAVLKGAQVLYEESSLLLFWIVKAEQRRYKCRDPLSQH